MDFDDAIPLTDEDWAAADELLRRRPDLVDKVDEVSRRYFAIQHARWGRKRFRRRLGLSRPRNRLEALHGEFFQGKITREEYGKRLRDYAHRPVDEEMLQRLVRDSNCRLKTYSQFLQMVLKLDAGDQAAKIEDDDRLMQRLKRKRRLFKEELLTANQFLTEARISHHLSLASNGEFSAPTADQLVQGVLDYVQKSWPSCRQISRRSQTDRRYLYATTAWRLFLNNSFPRLPRPQELTNLVWQEETLGRLTLKQQQAAAQPAERLDINLDANTVNLNVNTRGARREKKEEPPKLVLVVQRWEDLAIGIDECRHFWALTPAPAVGDIFTKSKAVLLQLGGKKWPKLLHAMAEAPEPGQLDIYRAVQALELLPPSGSLPRQAQTIAADVNAGYVADLNNQQTPWREQLTSQLANLARRLRKRISGPTGKSVASMRLDGDRVICSFPVRYLVKDAHGNVHFGTRPH